jgi:hypothetical protein
LHEEQAHGLGFTGFDACIFLLIQAEYRGFTGTVQEDEPRAAKTGAFSK